MIKKGPVFTGNDKNLPPDEKLTPEQSQEIFAAADAYADEVARIAGVEGVCLFEFLLYGVGGATSRFRFRKLEKYHGLVKPVKPPEEQQGSPEADEAATQ